MAVRDLTGLAADGNGYSAGPGAAVIDLRGLWGRALPLICYEGVFPRDVRAAPGRPDLCFSDHQRRLVRPISGPYQHLAQARLRSAEQGLPMIRVANTGVSAMIDAARPVTGRSAPGRGGLARRAAAAAAAPHDLCAQGDWPALWRLGCCLVGVATTRGATPGK